MIGTVALLQSQTLDLESGTHLDYRACGVNPGPLSDSEATLLSREVPSHVSQLTRGKKGSIAGKSDALPLSVSSYNSSIREAKPDHLRREVASRNLRWRNPSSGFVDE